MNLFKAITAKLVSLVLFVVMSALVRSSARRSRSAQIVFFRSCLRDHPGGADLRVAAQVLQAVATSRPLGHVGRGLISVCGMFLNFAALARLPLVDATAISFAAPLITVAFAAIFLNERVRVYRWSAVVVGFIGVIVMLWPYFDFEHFTAGDAAAATAPSARPVRWSAAIFNAGSVIQTRRLTATETTSSIVFYFSLICALAGLADACRSAGMMPTRPELAGAGRASAFSAGSRISSSPRAIATRRPRWSLRSTTRRCSGRFCSAMSLFGEVPTPLSLSAAASLRRRAVRDLARAPARAAPHARGRRRRRASSLARDVQNALKVMMVRVSWMPGMICTFSFTKWPMSVPVST